MLSQIATYIRKFRHLIFNKFHLDDADRLQISEIINQDSQFTTLYWVQMVLSSIIASFGLLQNSVAVVIGAMLIAPLLQPIQGIAFAVIRGDGRKFWHNFSALLGSIILGAGIGYLATIITPIRFETTEVLARTAPNVLDLFIAIASAVIAFLALSYKKLSSSLAGVAMAASLIPPLCVVGITLALGNIALAWGSMFLFITNVLAIILVGAFVFFIYGFEPYYEKDKIDAFKGVSILVALVIIISIPLTSTLIGFTRSLKIEKTAREHFERTLSHVLPSATITSFSADTRSTDIQISTVITLPEDETFYAELQETVSNSLSEVLEKDVTISFEIVRGAVAVTKKDLSESRQQEIEQAIKNAVRQKIKQYTTDADILNMEITQFDIVENIDSEEKIEAYTIRTVTSDFSNEVITSVEKDLRAVFPDIQLSFVWKNLTAEGVASLEKEASAIHRDKIVGDVRRVILPLLTPGQEIADIKVLWVITPEYTNSTSPFNPIQIESYVLNLDMNLPRNSSFNLNATDKSALEQQLGKEIRVNVRKFFYDRIIY